MNRKMFILFFLFLVLMEQTAYSDSVSVSIFSLSDDRLTNSINFGFVPYSTSTILAPSYLQVWYTNTTSDWMLQVSTYNTQSQAGGGLYNGLVGLNNRGFRIPLLWQVYTNTNHSVTCSNRSGWGSIRDKRDTDWSSVLPERFLITNNCLGIYPFTGRTAKSPLSVYLGADFSNKSICGADNYDTSIIIELLPFSTYTFAPGINFQGISEINLIGDKAILYADLSDQDIISTVSFFYKDHSDTGYSSQKYYPGSMYYRVKAEIPASVITKNGVDYYFSALDEQANQTNSGNYFINVNPGVTAVIGSSGGVIRLLDGNPEDGDMKLSIPSAALEGNKSISLRQIYDASEVIPGTGMVQGQVPYMIYEFLPGLKLKRLSKLDLLYFDLDNDGKVELADGTITGCDEKKMALFWWDRYDWRYIGGEVDSVNNTVSAYVTHLATFALFSVDHLTKEAYRPKEKIITPNNDGINDVLYFGGTPGSFDITIFDVSGAIVRKISDVAEWDGRNSRGKSVESGIYIYQARVNVNGKEELMSGSIAVAK
ncbi:MAG: gliding motility-associated C-terminal domain-containing protein [bacterium]|nr:gliding motility-associated C-terminal domain-containing protein [bacterium]